MNSEKAQKLPDTLCLDGQDSPGDTKAPGTLALDLSNAPAHIGPGVRLGPYEVLETLGEGGMGVVYKAQDTILGRFVALKVLPPHLLRNQDSLQRFRTEAQAQARLNSPHVVTLYSMLEAPAGLILIMEYAEGQTLDKRILQGPVSVDEAMDLFDQILQGVERAHEAGIVHRDLKPANILITPQGRIKIMDFGVARIMDNSDISQPGSMIGTLFYIAPEQINGREADFRSDIYTLGITLFEAVTGRLPFERKTDYSLMHAHILEKPPSPRNLRRDVPPELENIILKAIQKEPDKRFQTARELHTALLKCKRNSTEDTSGHFWPGGRRFIESVFPFLYRKSVIDRRSGKHRLLGDLGLDALLVAIVFALVAALGLYPYKKPDKVAGQIQSTPLQTDAVSPLAVEPPASTTEAAPPIGPVPVDEKRAAKPERSTRATANRKPVPGQKPAPEQKNKYDSLKKAWGGS